MTAPNFCMLLRKHVANGRITSDLRSLIWSVFLYSKLNIWMILGISGTRNLIIELMGKHSNIIFCDENDMILDSIKHISAQVSSVREVLPGRTYFIPAQQDKMNPLKEMGSILWNMPCRNHAVLPKQSILLIPVSVRWQPMNSAIVFKCGR